MQQAGQAAELRENGLAEIGLAETGLTATGVTGAEAGRFGRKRVETVVETLANLRGDAESLAAVAHDARNLVTALWLYCDLLEEPGVLNPASITTPASCGWWPRPAAGWWKSCLPSTPTLTPILTPILTPDLTHGSGRRWGSPGQSARR